MAEKGKLLQQAQKHLTKGNLDRAIKVFQQLVEIDPKDHRLALRLADLMARTGRKKDAITHYEKVATIYIRDEFFPKAIAVYRTILRLNPEYLPGYEKLSLLYKKQGLEGEAISQLQGLYEIYEKKQDNDKMIDVLRIMAEMDSENLGFQVRLGESLARKGNKKDAAEAFAKAAMTLGRRGFHDRASELFNKIISLDPGNIAVRRELCSHYLESGHFVEARQEIEAILEAEPDDPRMVLLLGRILFKLEDPAGAEEMIARSLGIFKGLGELDGVMREYLFVAQVHQNNGELDEAEALYRQINMAVPGEAKAIKGLISISEARGDESGRDELLALLEGIPEASEAADDITEPLDIHEITEVLEPAEIEEDIELLDDDEGPGEDSLELESEVAEFQIGESELEDDLPEFVLDDAGAEAASETTQFDGDGERGLSGAPAETSLEDGLLEIDVYRKYGLMDKVTEILEDLESRFPDDPRVLEANADIQSGAGNTGAPAPASQVGFTEEMEEAGFFLSQGLTEEAENIYSDILQKDPGHQAAQAALAGLKLKAEPAVQSPAASPLPDPQGGEVIPPAAESETIPSTLSRAKLIVEDSVPEVGDFLDLAGELRTELAAEIEQESQPAPGAEGPVTFEEIFTQFKKGIAETLGDEEYETHYNLGIAYKDMGLTDDAIRELEISSRDPNLLQESLSLMSMCFMDKQDYDSAVKALLKAMETGRQEHLPGLNYQLGLAYEAKRQLDQALQAYETVKGMDISLQGLDEAIERVGDLLSGSQEELPPASTGDESLDNMLSDLIKEVEEISREDEDESPSEGDDPSPKTKKDRISYL